MKTLNEEQARAVTMPDRTVRIISGPGSGKSRCLTQRAKFLCERMNVNPSEVLMLTFSKKASVELTDRLEKLMGAEQVSKMTVGTFHSLAYRILYQHLFNGKGFKIQGEASKLMMYKRIIGNNGFRMSTPTADVIRIIGFAKNNLVTAQKFLDVYGYKDEAEKIEMVYRLTESAKDEMGALDYDDLLLRTYQLLNTRGVLGSLQARHRHIIVDEAQDLNPAITGILLLLAEKHRGLYVAADPHQSIHGYRAAGSDFVLSMPDVYKDTATVFLRKNYRNPKPVLEASHRLISHSSIPLDNKQVCASIDTQENPVSFHRAADEKAEAAWIAGEVEALIAFGEADYSDIAILVRMNNYALRIVGALASKGIPYSVIGSNFYELPEVKYLLAYLKVLHKPDESDESLLSVLNIPNRYMGTQAKATLEAHAREQGVSCYQALKTVSFGRSFLDRNIQKLKCDLEYLKDFPEGASAGDVLMEIRDVFRIDDYIKENFGAETEDDNRISNIDTLIKEANDYHNIGAYLEHINKRAVKNDNPEECVRVMSVHASKGLEMPVIFLPGLVEGHLPSRKSLLGGPSSLEEEMRIFFVALTRCIRQVFISYPANYEGKPSTVSRFLSQAFPERKF